MGLCLSCESKRSPVHPSPMMAKKWKISTMTSSEHPDPDRLTEMASIPSQQGNTPMLIFKKFGPKKDVHTSFSQHKFGSTTRDCGDDLHPVVKRVWNFLPPKLLSQHWEVKILAESNSQVKAKDLDSVCSGTTTLNLVKEVWDELWNRDVQAIVDRSPTRLCAARAVVNATLVGWSNKYKVDDDRCAVVCLFLDSPQESLIAEMRTKAGLHICSRPEQFVERV